VFVVVVVVEEEEEEEEEEVVDAGAGFGESVDGVGLDVFED